jgi:hypothetical protein
MTIQEILTVLFPYLSQMRKVEKYLSIDLIFPPNWEFPNQFIEKVQVVQNDKYKGPGTFLSFVCEIEVSMNTTLEIVFEIINHNLEREEKERLLKQKVVELKRLFEQTNLSDLKQLQINLPEPDPIKEMIDEEHEV